MKASTLTRLSRGTIALGLASGTLLCTSCQRAHSALAPVTPEASRIAWLWWIFFTVCTVIYLLVIGVLLGAITRHRRGAAKNPPPPEHPNETSERTTYRVVGAATGLTAVILVALLGADLWAQRSIPPRADNPLVIELTGHQWWWAAEYQDPDASQVFETANELHVPTGRPIRLNLLSADVIHSFWVPRLHGKRDLVPGHPAELTFQVDQPGRYEGQCAEFCGYQHAHMGIVIIAEDPGVFAAWADAERRPAPEPVTEPERRGRDAFERGTCAMCHTVHGTTARSRVGPPLTHFASRATLGAGVVANTRDHLRSWITDPHTFKPGVRMPLQTLPPRELEALLDYLQTLK